ncbi:MAG: hypothetical protein U0841_04740 [Chloroflexia bacterium]
MTVQVMRPVVIGARKWMFIWVVAMRTRAGAATAEPMALSIREGVDAAAVEGAVAVEVEGFDVDVERGVAGLDLLDLHADVALEGHAVAEEVGTLVAPCFAPVDGRTWGPPLGVGRKAWNVERQAFPRSTLYVLRSLDP